MKKKIVLGLCMLIGLGFLYIGFSSLQSKNAAETQTPDAEELLNQPADEISADALENISD